MTAQIVDERSVGDLGEASGWASQRTGTDQGQTQAERRVVFIGLGIRVNVSTPSARRSAEGRQSVGIVSSLGTEDSGGANHKKSEIERRIA